MGEAAAATKGKLGTMNSGLEAMVGNQGMVGDWVRLGYWRRGLPGLA